MVILEGAGVREVVLLSPHPDDISFSSGATVTWLAAQFPTTLVTVFGRTRWHPVGAEGPQNPETVSALRSREDAAYASAIGARRVGLGFADASLRGYDDRTELGSLLPGDSAPGRVEDALTHILSRSRRTLVFAPQGIGGHVDHRIVRDALFALAPPGPILLYEDLPYAAHMTARADPDRPALPADKSVPLAVRFPAAALARKLRMAALYASQLRTEDRLRIVRAAVRGGPAPDWTERFLLVDAGRRPAGTWRNRKM